MFLTTIAGGLALTSERPRDWLETQYQRLQTRQALNNGITPPQGLIGQTPLFGGAFGNCTAARAAGAAPLHRGEPGYGPHLDRDDDGVACEPYFSP